MTSYKENFVSLQILAATIDLVGKLGPTLRAGLDIRIYFSLFKDEKVSSELFVKTD